MKFESKDLSHETLVLNHLQRKGKISPLQALRDYSCLRLAAVVYRLRRRGHRIVTDWREQKGTRYAVYRLESWVSVKDRLRKTEAPE